MTLPDRVKLKINHYSLTMIMKLDKVVPFGRSLDEYKRMFSLSTSDLAQRILGIADGPASFNVEMQTLGHRVVSIDPVYQFNSTEIEDRFYSVVDDIIQQVKATPNNWVWTYHGSPDQLRKNRISVFQRFIADYEKGKDDGRYVIGELPRLDLEQNQFQLALCSHFLFLYSDHLTYEFHQASVMEMLRVAEEVRIFPLLTLMLTRSPYVEPLIADLKSKGYSVSIEKVNYELQRGGNEMLRICKPQLT